MMTTEETVPLTKHLTLLRVADQRFSDERDRRYSEVKLAEEKALAIKSTSDDKALLLARDIQDLKDEKANNLRSQIDGERGAYATHDQLDSAVERIGATMKPLADYITAQIGRDQGGLDNRTDRRLNWQQLMQLAATVATLITLLLLIAASISHGKLY